MTTSANTVMRRDSPQNNSICCKSRKKKQLKKTPPQNWKKLRKWWRDVTNLPHEADICRGGGVTSAACYVNGWCCPARRWRAKVLASLTSMKTSLLRSGGASLLLTLPSLNRRVVFFGINRRWCQREGERNRIWGYFSSAGFVLFNVAQRGNWTGEWAT